MLSKVDVISINGGVLELPIYDPDDDQEFPIRDIQGLDPVKANLVSSSFAQLDGAQFQSSRRETRNIIFKLGMYSDFVDSSIQQLRRYLYTFLMPKSNVTLRFYVDDGTTIDIEGYVETFDAPLFVKDPEATISLLCYDPDFKSINPVQIEGVTVPTAIDTPIDYEGDVDTGFIFTLLVNRTIDEFVIANILPGGSVIALGFASSAAPLLNGDILTISTVPGSKYARFVRGGVTSSILWGIDPTSDWLKLFPGVNNIRVQAAGAAIPWTIDYTDRFGGL